MRDKYLKIYLAGAMSGLSFDEMNKWREDAKKIIRTYAHFANYKVDIINPVDFYNFENIRHQSEEEVEDFDLAHATSSDIIVCNIDKLNTSDGTKFELHDCNFHNHIPVIAFGERDIYEKLHPWVKRDITRIEKDIYNVAKYIQDFYMR